MKRGRGGKRVRTLAGLGAAVACLLVGGLAGLYAVGGLTLPTAVRSGFLAVAAVLGLGVFLATHGEKRPASSSLVAPTRAAKLVVAVGGLAVAATAWTGSRLLPLLVALPVCYLLVADQLLGDPPAAPVLVSLMTLFAVPVLSKYLTTGFYFAGTDTFAHVDAVGSLLGANYTTAIPHGYDYFPVFHVVAGAVTLVGDLASYDAILLLGIVVYTALVPTAYLLGARLFDDRRTALSVAAAVVLLELVAKHALYFFPQAFALVLVAVLFYVAASMPAVADARRFHALGGYAVMLVAVLVLTHHLTYVLLLAPVGLVFGLALVRPHVASVLGWSALRASAERRPRLRYRWLFPGVFGLVALATYLLFSPSLILFGIIGYGYDVTGQVATAAGPDTFLYGVTLPADSPDRALTWLRTPTGLYYTLLATVFLVGLYEFLGSVEGYARRASLLFGSFVVAVVLLPLPVEIPQVDRVQFVASLFALFPLGLGVARLLRPSPRVGRVWVVALVVVFAALGTVTPLTGVAGDDLEGVHLSERGAQVEMTDGEYAAVVETGRFLRANGRGAVGTDFVASRAFASAMDRPPRGLIRTTEAGLSRPPGYLVVRDRWTEHFTPVSVDEGVVADEVNWFATSERRLRASVAHHDKVYDTGETAVLASTTPFRGLLGNATTPE